MIENQIRLDNSLFLLSVLLGFFFGLYYEIFRFIRLALPHFSLMVLMEDLLFFLPISASFILFNFVFSDGVLRWFSLAGVGMGFFLYLGTLGKLLCFFSDRILRFVRLLLNRLYKITLFPLYNIIKKVTITLFTKYKKAVIIIEKKRKRKRLIKEKKALIRSAEKGFFVG